MKNKWLAVGGVVTIYLAGGMNSNWRDSVVKKNRAAKYLNPAKHGLSIPEQYTAWDLKCIDISDIVFAYWGKDNPSGFGLALEIGYARAKNKLIIFVNEAQNKYSKMLEESSSINFTCLKDGIECLSKIIANYGGNK